MPKIYTVNYFPFERDNATNSLRRCESVNDTLISSMKTYILTRRGSRLGSMIGSIVPDMLLNTYSKEGLKTQANILKQDLTRQFPGANILEITMENELSDNVSSLIIKIKFNTPISDITTFELVFNQSY